MAVTSSLLKSRRVSTWCVSTARDDVTRQTAVINRIERRVRWTVTSHCRTEERITRHGCGWHRRHRQSRQRHERRCRRAGDDFAIGQRARAGNRNTARVEHCARFKYIVRTPQFPHAFREVRIEVAVEN